MPTPQEKALSICQNITMTTFGSDFNEGKALPSHVVKWIAVICVDEILNAIYQVIGNQKWMWNLNEQEQVEYFESVKEAITLINT